MLKRDELSDPNSCFNRAADDEMIFVLLARDVAAPAIIRVWAEERVRLGKNLLDDAQIVGAIQCADAMEKGERPPEKKGNCLSQNKAIRSTFPDPAIARDRIGQLPNDEFRLVSIMAELLAFQANTIDTLADCLVREAARLERTNGFVRIEDLKREAQALRDYANTLAPAAPEANR